MARVEDVVALIGVLGRISVEELSKTDSNGSNASQATMEIDLSVLSDSGAQTKIQVGIQIETAALPEVSNMETAVARMQEQWKYHSSKQNCLDFSVSWISTDIGSPASSSSLVTICTVVCEIQSLSLIKLVNELSRSFGKDSQVEPSDYAAEPHFEDGVFIIPDISDDEEESEDKVDVSTSNAAVHIAHALSSVIRSSRDLYWRQECKRLLGVSSVDEVETKLEELLRSEMN